MPVPNQESEQSCTCVLGVPNQESEQSCTCVLGVSILPLSMIFLLDFGNVPTVVYFLLFILFTSKICLCFPELYVFDILGAGSTYIYI